MSENIKFEPLRKNMTPMLGAAYYPEDWDESEQVKDIENMVKVGINVVRIAEFAWRMMEPSDGQFEFGWLHRVIDRLGNAGIAVILGTPSATPPKWVEEKDPNMLSIDKTGLRQLHGGRRHCCSNNPTYRKYSLRIAEKMAVEFGDDPRIIGWQIDNEILGPADCCCEHCHNGFIEYLKDKYKTVDNLNRQFNHNIFSQWYDSFEQIPSPTHSWQNPHILLEWKTFNMLSHVRFIHEQADVLHKYVKAPVGTDMMPTVDIDYDLMNSKLDVVQFNHYNADDNLWLMPFWFDYFRNVTEHPFWNTETATCWSGSTAGTGCQPEGFCSANSWLPIILGGEANMYWLWRQHWAGHELMHGSVLYANGRPMHIFSEVQKIAADYEKASDFLTNTRVKTDIAMQVSSHNNNMNEHQLVSYENAIGILANHKSPYLSRLRKFYGPMHAHGIRTDVLGENKGFDGYKLLFSINMLTLEIGDMPERIEKWVKDGGTWFVGPLTDIRTSVGAHYTDRAMGMVERLTGAELVDSIPDPNSKIKMSWADGSEFKCTQWHQLYNVPENAEVLATVTDGYSTLLGKAVAFKVKVGKGSVIVLGTMPNEQEIIKLCDIALEESGAKRFNASSSIIAAGREGNGMRGIALTEIAGKEGTIEIDCPMTDILTGESFEGTVPVAPWQTRILKA